MDNQPAFLTVGEFQRMVTSLERQMDNGFKGVHNRLDIANGRTGKNEQAIAGLQADYANTQREIERIAASVAATPTATPTQDGGHGIKMIAAVAAAVCTILVSILAAAAKIVMESGK